jgi:hypothetical protein
MNQDSGWRKRQIALDIKAENARELELDYEPSMNNETHECDQSKSEFSQDEPLFDEKGWRTPKWITKGKSW